MKSAYTTEYLWGFYLEKGTLKKVAAVVGLCAQSVHERFQAAGLRMNRSPWKAAEIEVLKTAYASPLGVDIASLAAQLNRPYSGVALKASKLGLTEKRGKHNRRPETIERMKEEGKARWQRLPHPRGAQGMKHSAEALEKMSASSTRFWKNLSPAKKAALIDKRMKAQSLNGTLVQERKNVTWKGGWREIGGVNKYFRSKWEANYAYYLEWLKTKGEIQQWEHEPTTFWFEKIKRGCRSYLPDFRVIEKDGTEVYHEVKGWMDSRSKTKIKRMAIYYPKVKLIVVDSKQYQALRKQLKNLVPGWEK